MGIFSFNYQRYKKTSISLLNKSGKSGKNVQYAIVSVISKVCEKKEVLDLFLNDI